MFAILSSVIHKIFGYNEINVFIWLPEEMWVIIMSYVDDLTLNELTQVPELNDIVTKNFYNSRSILYADYYPNLKCKADLFGFKWIDVVKDLYIFRESLVKKYKPDTIDDEMMVRYVKIYDDNESRITNITAIRYMIKLELFNLSLLIMMEYYEIFINLFNFMISKIDHTDTYNKYLKFLVKLFTVYCEKFYIGRNLINECLDKYRLKFK